MSSEAGAAAKQIDDSRGLAPRLRFPEFRDTGEWTRRKLGAHLIEHAGRVAASTEIPVYSSSRSGLTPQGEYFDGSNLQNFGEYSVVPEGYITFRHMSDDGIFKFNQNMTGRQIAVSKEYPVFTTSGISSPFLLYILNNSHAFRRFALSQKKGGTRTRLYLSVLRTWEPLLPPDEAEQQKIAECLSSLDSLIAAETEKLATLRNHMKSLMLRLFPRPERFENGVKIPAETTPRLRFPEFRDAGAWETKPLGDIFDTASGGTPDRKNKEFWGGEIPWITTSLVDGNIVSEAAEFITEKGLKGSSAKIFPKNTVLIAMYGQGKTRGKVALLGIEAATNQACAAILPKVGIDPAYAFLNLCARYEEIRALSNSGGQDNLSQELVGSLPFPFPHDEKEQQKIAECLLSFDSLITEQNGKIEALKTHKSGLMQQLFPSPAETAA